MRADVSESGNLASEAAKIHFGRAALTHNYLIGFPGKRHVDENYVPLGLPGENGGQDDDQRRRPVKVHF
jgi:hypothetical protein